MMIIDEYNWRLFLMIGLYRDYDFTKNILLRVIEILNFLNRSEGRYLKTIHNGLYKADYGLDMYNESNNFYLT